MVQPWCVSRMVFNSVPPWIEMACDQGAFTSPRWGMRKSCHLDGILLTLYKWLKSIDLNQANCKQTDLKIEVGVIILDVVT